MTHPVDELFYLVRWIEGEDESDMSAMEFELDPVEWQAFVESEQLVFECDPYMDSAPENSNLAKIRDLLMKSKQNDRCKNPSGKWLSECYLFGAHSKRIRKKFATKGEALSHECYIINSTSDLSSNTRLVWGWVCAL